MRYCHLLMLASILCFSCNEDFNPIGGTLEKKYTVFCILDNRLTNQIVRVTPLYVNDSLKKMPKNTRVVLTGYNGIEYTLHDMVIPKLGDYSFYYYPYKLPRGYSYRLTVISDPYPIEWASTFYFASPYNFYVNPIESGLDYKFDVYFLKNASKVNLLNMFIEYENKAGDSIHIRNTKVPISHKWNVAINPYMEQPIYTYTNDNSFTLLFPDITVDNSSPYYKSSGNNILVSYSGDYIIYTLKNLPYSGTPQDVTIKRAYVVFYSIDYDFYNAFLKNEIDKVTVRMDEPIYPSNFNNTNGKGLGFFASITADTAYFRIFNELIMRFGYNDGQK